MVEAKATFADIVADAMDREPDFGTHGIAAAILADPRLVELLAEALLSLARQRGYEDVTVGDAEDEAADIIRSLGEATA